MALPGDFTEQLAATADDPNAFSELVFGSPLHDGQVRYHEEHNGQVNFLLPGNSWGKTEFIARYILWLGWFKRGKDYPFDGMEGWLTTKFRMLVASYAYGVAQESFDRLVEYARNNERVKALIAKSSETDYEIHLVNGTRIDWGSLDGKGRLVEAARYNHIFVDEVGHIPDLSAVYDNVLYPRTLGVKGVIHFFGTPKSYSDPYLLEIYEKGKGGGDGFYYSQAGSVLENSFWPKEEADRVLANPRYVRGWELCPDPDTCTYGICRNDQHPLLTPVGRQVLLGDFLLAGGLFFKRLHVSRVFEPFDAPPVVWAGDDHFAAPPIPGHLYHAAFDLGGNKKRVKKKVGSDATVGFVIDYTTFPFHIVRYDYIEGGDADWEDKYRLMADVYRLYRLPYLTIDCTGNLDSVQEALYDRGIEVEGIHFGGTGNKKFDMLRNLQLVLELEHQGERGLLRSPLIPRMRHELEHYVLPDDDIVQDCVMALAMVCQQVMHEMLPDAVGGEVY